MEHRTQLLTFRKDLLPHLSIPHLVLQNRGGSEKVDGGKWAGKLARKMREKNFFSVPGHLTTLEKLLPFSLETERKRD